MDAEERAQLLLAAPAGCALLVRADQAGLSADALSRPRTAMRLALEAVDALRPWRGGDHLALVAELRDRASRLGDLALAVASHPQLGWWWEDLGRDAQHEPLEHVDGQLPPLPTAPTTPSSGWELYAQKSRGARWTSSVRDGTSTMVLAISRGVGDVSVPAWSAVASTAIDEHARVYEVHRPEDWHQLCLQHPAIFDGSSLEQLAGTTVPDWCSVAEQFEAVHLSLGGLLSSLWQTTTSAAGTTTLWSWEFEGTHWLRPAFTRGPAVVHDFQDRFDEPWEQLPRPWTSTGQPLHE